jgi:predicted CoA-binding protein
MLKPEQKVDMVDIFRNSAWAGATMDEAVEQFIPVIWTQLGVVDDAAKLRAKEKGAIVIVDRFPKVNTPFPN